MYSKNMHILKLPFTPPPPPPTPLGWGGGKYSQTLTKPHFPRNPECAQTGLSPILCPLSGLEEDICVCLEGGGGGRMQRKMPF